MVALGLVCRTVRVLQEAALKLELELILFLMPQLDCKKNKMREDGAMGYFGCYERLSR